MAAEDVAWNELRLRSRVRPALSLLTGVAVVLPLLGVFGALYAAADPVFGELAALQRIRLYQAEYGLTEARVFATAFVLWLAVVVLWLAVTVLAARPQRFAVEALVSAFAGVLALNALNPDALIARTNVERAAARREIAADWRTWNEARAAARAAVRANEQQLRLLAES